MKNLTLLFVLLLTSTVCISQKSSQKKIKALIVDGQNNHVQWPKITAMLKSYLEETGKFSVEVQRSQYTWKGEEFIAAYPIEGTFGTEALEKPKADPNFKPKFSDYDVVVVNFGWNAAPWSAETQASLEKYMKKGGGLVVIHAADNSFPEWPAYNQMIGLGGWGNRTEKDGPYVYYNNEGELQRDMSPGKGGAHGPQHEFVVKIRNEQHPITKGMPSEWLHTKDELYSKLRGPAENMEVIATSYASKEYKGTERHEPMMMVLDYGKGRIFHTPMGHADYSVECVGFITSFLRGSEWAATKKVTIPIPTDFPNKENASKRAYDK